MSLTRGSIPAAFKIVCLLAMVAGCATVAETDSTDNAAAKKFEPVAGSASIYFCRPGQGVGDTLVAQTELDGVMTGALAPNTFILISVPPGHHTLTVLGPTNTEDLTADVTAGNVYFYKVSVDWAGPGVRHRHIVALSDEDGRSAVDAETRAVATTNPS
jgi:hypothetical protein